VVNQLSEFCAAFVFSCKERHSPQTRIVLAPFPSPFVCRCNTSVLQQ
jgi:hypothetical protein